MRHAAIGVLVLPLFLIVMVPAALVAQESSAQIKFGQIGLRVTDPEAHKKIWVELLGAKAVKLGTVDAIEFPGTFVILKKAEPSAGSDGSSLNHFGVLVRDIDGTLRKLTAANIEKVGDLMSRTPRQFTVSMPDGVRVEFTEDTDLATPLANHHMHARTNDPEAVRAWYVKAFGLTAGMRAGKTFTAGSTTGNFLAVATSGGEVDFAKIDMPQAPTKGRAIDHIGFEVRGLEALARELTRQGIAFDAPLHTDPDTNVKTVYVVDPMGMRIALTEGLPTPW
jgi:catechol 2,3-dioxygenase-like lactoylglutathione lyase family enzyme